MALKSINEALSEFSPDDRTPSLIHSLFGVIPGSPRLIAWRNLAQAAQTLKPGLTEHDLNRVRGAAQEDAFDDLLWMAGLVDSADKGYAVFTGLSSAFKLFTGRKGAMELDEEQRNDAVAKAIAIAYMAWKAYPGSPVEKAKHMAAHDAGRALLQYWVAVEVCLPFADNVAEGGAKFVTDMLHGGTTRQLQRLTSLAGGRSLGGAADVLQGLTNTIQKTVEQTARHTKPISEAVGKYAGGVLSAVDATTGLAATAADVLPSYRYLGGRLAAEGAVIRAFGPLQS